MTGAPEAGPGNWNVPNALTVLRIVLVPVFATVLFLHPHDHAWRIAATAVFVAAILTDLLDGWLARRLNQVTNFGKLWDPVADKALTGTAFVGLGILGELPWFFIVLILVREWGITWLRAAIARHAVMAANRGGKAKTVAQSIALALFLLWLPTLPGWLQAVAWAVMWVALVLTLVTGVDYVLQARRLLRRARAQDPTDPVGDSDVAAPRPRRAR